MTVRQRPQTAKGKLFVLLEDESGLLDLVARPDVYERLREKLWGHPLLIASGLVQRNGQAVSILVAQAWSLRE